LGLQPVGACPQHAAQPSAARINGNLMKPPYREAAGGGARRVPVSRKFCKLRVSDSEAAIPISENPLSKGGNTRPAQSGADASVRAIGVKISPIPTRGASRQACRVGCRADFSKAETTLGGRGRPRHPAPEIGLILTPMSVRARPPGRAFAPIVNSYAGQHTGPSRAEDTAVKCADRREERAGTGAHAAMFPRRDLGGVWRQLYGSRALPPGRFGLAHYRRQADLWGVIRARSRSTFPRTPFEAVSEWATIQPRTSHTSVTGQSQALEPNAPAPLPLWAPAANSPQHVRAMGWRRPTVKRGRATKSSSHPKLRAVPWESRSWAGCRPVRRT
jgi:hypothetical protein